MSVRNVDSTSLSKGMSSACTSKMASHTHAYGSIFIPSQWDTLSIQDNVSKSSIPSPVSKSRPRMPKSFIPSVYTPPPSADLPVTRPILYPSKSFDFCESGYEQDRPEPSRSSRSSHPRTYLTLHQCCGECWLRNIISISPFSKLEAIVQDATFINCAYHFM